MKLKTMVSQYNPELALENASTPPSSWYIDESLGELENQTVFTSSWLIAARADQFTNSGDYVATEVAGENIVIVQGEELKAFYNVCKHHAAQIMEDGEGCARSLQCPYHGWTYRLDGSLQTNTQFEGVCNFEKENVGLTEIRLEVWEKWVFVCLDNDAPDLKSFLGDMYSELRQHQLADFKFRKRVIYDLDCNWKVFVDNYLDGGYHVPFLHSGLASALDNRNYKIEVADKYCLQSCPTRDSSTDVSSVRKGDMAYYYWLYPNLMINIYEGIMDINIAIPLSAEKCRIIFEYYFTDSEQNTDEFIENSIKVAHQVQVEDLDVCHSVQKGLHSRSYDTGRLSVKKEAGEHLFHKLLYGH